MTEYKRALDEIYKELQEAEKQSTNDIPRPWPILPIDDGLGGEFVLTFIGVREQKLCASVSITDATSGYWQTLMQRYAREKNRLCVVLVPDPDLGSFSYVPFAIQDNELNKDVLNTLPPPKLPPHQ